MSNSRCAPRCGPMTLDESRVSRLHRRIPTNASGQAQIKNTKIYKIITKTILSLALVIDLTFWFLPLSFKHGLKIRN